MKNFFMTLGLLAFLLIGVIMLASGITDLKEAIILSKPMMPKSVVMIIDDNLWKARTKSMDYIRKGFIIKEVQNFQNSNSPYYRVMIILEKY